MIKPLYKFKFKILNQRFIFFLHKSMIDNPGLTSDENDSDYVLNSQRNEDQTK